MAGPGQPARPAFVSPTQRMQNRVDEFFWLQVLGTSVFANIRLPMYQTPPLGMCAQQTNLGLTDVSPCREFCYGEVGIRLSKEGKAHG